MTITIKSYIEAVKAKGWEYEWLDKERYTIIVYPPGEQPILIRNNVTELGSAIGTNLANLKYDSTLLASKVGFRVPKTIVIEGTESPLNGEDLLKETGRIVVKPMDAAYGDGISTNVRTAEELKSAVELARQHCVVSEAVVVQEYCEGRDFRLFMLAGQLVAAIERVPLMLEGDGVHTISQLIDKKIIELEAKDDNKIKPIKINRDQLIETQKLESGKILDVGEVLSVQGVANLSKGGFAIDITDIVNEKLVILAKALAELMSLDMCAVDVLSNDISKDPDVANTVFIEINAAPGFRGHYYPAIGKRRELAAMILDAIVSKRKGNITIAKVNE